MSSNVHFFDPPTLSDEQSGMRELLSALAPKSADDVRMVAAALKTDGVKYEAIFLEWAKPFGRFKAKGLWAKARPDPDALTEVLERQIVAAGRKARFKLQSAAELDPSPIEYRIKFVAPAEGVFAIYGPSGSGKSFLAADAAAAIAEGRPFFNYPTKKGPVLYIGLEGEAGVRGRVLAWEREHGRKMPEGIRFLLQPFHITDPQDVADLAAMCAPGCVVIIDTLNRAAPGMDENSPKDMGVIIEGAKTLQRAIAGLVILVAHTGKDATKGLRGHSSLFAALDGAIMVERTGDNRSWKVDKAKDGKDGEEHGFRLKTVCLGTDDDGDDITSCVVEPDPSAKSPQGPRPLSGNPALALSTFHEVAGIAGRLDPTGAFAGLHVEDWRKAFYRRCTADNDAAKRKAFQRARTELVDRGELAVADDMYRPGGPNAHVTEQMLGQRLRALQDTAT